MDDAPAVAREYLRVSRDHSGRMRSPKEQHDDDAKAAAGNGWTLGAAYEEPEAVSASRYSRSARGGFARLMADLEHGRFGADILIIWESSRGSRRVGEWASLVDLLDDAGVKVFVTSHNRLYDPANPRDRRSLMEDAVDSEYQSGKQSVQIARALAANAVDGKPHGRVPYGYRRLYDVLPSGRRVLAGQEADPDEAPVIVELFGRLDAGESLRAIARDFDERGIRTRIGKPFVSQHLRELALRPAYGGYRTHTPGSTAGGVYRGPLPAEPNASWPALVDLDVFWRVRRLLLSPERRTSRPGRGKHLLSLIGRCDVCGGPLTVRYRRGERMYTCRERYCMAILADDLDQLAENVMLAYLSRPANLRAIREVPEGELAAVAAELTVARAELAELRAAGRAKRLTVATVLTMEPGLIADVERLEQKQRELTTPDELAGMVGDGDEVAQRWKAATVPARRTVARLLLGPACLGTLRVQRSPETGRGHRVAAHERVRWDRPEVIHS